MDSYADFGSYKGSGRGWIDFICQEHLKFLHHSHQVTNIIIETAGVRAGSESYVTATLRSREGSRVLQRQFWARYVDEWSRRDGLWAIDKRECVIDFDSVSEVTSHQRTQPQPARRRRPLLRRAAGGEMMPSVSVPAEKYGPWAVIAGGSEGIGACIAQHLAKAGINLVLVARKVEPLEVVAASLRARTSAEVRILSLDLTGAAMLDRIREATDDLEVGLLVYDPGGLTRTGPFVDWPLEDVLKVIRLNTEGQAVLAHFGKKMAARGKGGIISSALLRGMLAVRA